MQTFLPYPDFWVSAKMLDDKRLGKQRVEAMQIRLPNHLGIAGAVFTSGKSINIPYAYADLRFNPAFDKKTGFFTRSILCVPIVNKHGKVIGVTQVLNKRGGSFTPEDESRLKAFSAQVSIGLENAQLFNDVQRILAENLPVLYFAAPRMYAAHTPRVRAVVPSVLRPPILWNADSLSVAGGAGAAKP